MKQGLFNLELVNSENRQSFQEHTKGSKTYAEVEPEIEYFVRVLSEASDTVYVDIEIDGKRIEQGRRVKDQMSEAIGICKRDNNYLEQNALRFNKSEFKSGNEQSFAFWTGVVTAIFYGPPEYRIQRPNNSGSASSSSIQYSQNSENDQFKNSDKTPNYRPRKNVVYTGIKDNVSGNVGLHWMK